MTLSAEPFPTSISSLLLNSSSTIAHHTLTSLRRNVLSTHNRLESISKDALFVQDIATKFDLPLIANERCGSWYIPTDKKIESAYFKSTDGHYGAWAFSKRRLNLQVLEVVERHGGYLRKLKADLEEKGN